LATPLYRDAAGWVVEVEASLEVGEVGHATRSAVFWATVARMARDPRSLDGTS
jgi:hypothetical protein